MKKTTLLLLLGVLTYLMGCNKSNSPTQVVAENALPVKAETKAKYDNTNFGVYKGVIIGSTGIIVFYINNEDNVVKAYLTIDGQKDTLTTSYKFTLGKPIVDALFTGRISSVVLNTDENGNNASLSNIKISGHPNVASYIVHERSLSQVICYEGTIDGDIKGTINCIRFGKPKDTVVSIVKYANNDTTFRGFGGNEYDSRYPEQSTDTSFISFVRPNQSKQFAYIGGRFIKDSLFVGRYSDYTLSRRGIEGKIMCKRTY